MFGVNERFDHSTAPVIGTGKRVYDYRSTQPAPGSYNIPSSLDTNAPTLKSRTKIRAVSTDSPGPA